MVESLLLKQLCVASREGLLGADELCGEAGDDRLRLTDGPRFQLFDAVCEAVDEAEYSLGVAN